MLLVAFFFLSSAWAEHCEMSYPVQDQDGLNVCYANSATLMAQATDPEHRPRSFLAAAIMSAGKSIDTAPIDTTISGSEDWATNGCSVYGRLKTCPAEFFPLEGSSNKLESTAELRFLSTLAVYFKGDRADIVARMKLRARQPGAARDLAYLLASSDYTKATGADAKEKKENFDKVVNASSWANSACGSAGNATIAEEKVQDAQELLDAILAYTPGTKDVNEEFLKLVAPRCHENLIPVPGECDEVEKKKVKSDAWNERTSNATVSKSICAGKPVTFNGCIHMLSLTGFTDESVARSNLLGSVNNSGDCATRGGGHVMTVVGTRNQGGGVQYLVQNSWGKACYVPGGLFAGLECQKDAEGYTGRTWVPEEIFKAQAYRIGFIK